jgi:nucleolar protein 15
VKPTKGKKKAKVAVATNGDATEPAVTIAIAEEPKTQDKPKKQGKKGKAVAATNGDAAEPEVAVTVAVVPKAAQEKPKKQAKKTKAVEAEEPVVVEAPAEKAKPAKKGKKAAAAPVEEEEQVAVETPVKKAKKAKAGKKQDEPTEEVAEPTAASEEVDGEVEEDDQTAALLAGFESDDEEAKDPENDHDFDENASVPALTKKQRTALEKATQGPRSNVPGVIYIGCVS